jgi:HK97 gp10 family phage protein
MSLSITVQVSFADKLVNAIETAFPEALEERVATRIQEVGGEMRDDAQRIAPKRTGYMASQISFEILPWGKWAFRLIGRAPYTLYQELGTRRMQPRLFMTQAVEIHRVEMLMAIQAAVEETVREVFAR